MSTTVGQLADSLQQRIRDPIALAMSTAVPPSTASGRLFVYTLLTIAQQAINDLERQVVITYVLLTKPQQSIYQISTVFAQPATDVQVLNRPLQIQSDVQTWGRFLSYIPFRTLNQMDNHWIRRMGPTFLYWSMFGRDQLILWPANPNASAVNVIGTKVLTPLTSDAQLIELSDDTVPQILDFAEMLAQIKMVKPEEVSRPMEKFKQEYSADLNMDDWITAIRELE